MVFEEVQKCFSLKLLGHLSMLALVMAILGRLLTLTGPWLKVARVGSESDLVEVDLKCESE